MSPYWVVPDRFNRFRASIRSMDFDQLQNLHDQKPDGLRVTERASLAGNVSLSSSSSR
jgi:hypothetical protein